MLQVVVGVVAGLLVLIGIAIMAGPVLPRLLGLRGRQSRFPAPASPRRGGRGARGVPGELHPTTLKALAATARLLGMLKEQGMERHAAALRMAGKRLQVDEAAGIMAMRQVLRHLRSVRLDDESDHKIFQGLVGQLQKELDDRAEQLELLPKN